MRGFSDVQSVTGSLNQAIATINRLYPFLYYTWHLVKAINEPTAQSATATPENWIESLSASDSNSVMTYMTNVDTMAALARGADIPAILCLQATLPFKENGKLRKNVLSDIERVGPAADAPWGRIEELNSYFTLAKEYFANRIKRNSGSVRYCDMTDVFRDEPDQTYIDGVHLTQKGNELVARRFLNEIAGITHQ